MTADAGRTEEYFEHCQVRRSADGNSKPVAPEYSVAVLPARLRNVASCLLLNRPCYRQQPVVTLLQTATSCNSVTDSNQL
jgi:hypothetical protein